MTDLVSILIPSYNSEKWLSETLESAINQTWHNKEIIVVDDGSSDNSLTIAKNYESQMVKVIHQDNRGAGASRNRALREAQGDFIQFLDADDILSIDKIAAQINILIDNPDKVAVCNTIHFYDGEDYLSKLVDDEWYLYDTNDPVEFLIKLYGGDGKGGMIQPNAYLTPRNIIEKAGIWEEFYSPDDDGEYFCRVVLASNGIKFSRQGINYYRKYVQAQSLSRANSLVAMEGRLRSLNLRVKHLLTKTNSERAKKALARCYMEQAFICYPRYPKITAIALQKIEELGGTDYLPIFGTWKGEFIKKTLGWKVAKMVQFQMSNLSIKNLFSL